MTDEKKAIHTPSQIIGEQIEGGNIISGRIGGTDEATSDYWSLENRVRRQVPKPKEGCEGNIFHEAAGTIDRLKETVREMAEVLKAWVFMYEDAPENVPPEARLTAYMATVAALARAQKEIGG